MALAVKGTVIEISSDGATYTKIGDITDFNRDGMETDEIDATAIDDNYKKYIYGLIDRGGLSVTVNYTPQDAGLKIAEAVNGKGTDIHMRIKYTDVLTTTGTIQDFTAVVKSINYGGSLGDKYSGSISMRVTSEVTESVPT